MPTKAHRAGLNKYENVPSLLQSVNRAAFPGQRSVSAHNASPEIAPLVEEKSSRDSEQDESFIFAEPVSDDEEDLNNERVSHSSDEEEAGRGDIRPTNFTVNGDIRSRATRDTSDDDGFGPIRDNISRACSVSQVKSPLRRSRRNGSESANNTPKKARLEPSYTHEAIELDLFTTTSSKSRRRPMKTYGSQSKPQGSRGSQSNGESSPEAVFKKPPQVQSEMPESPEKKFTFPERIVSEEPEMETGRTFKTFDLPVCSPDSSPNKIPQFKLGPDLSELPGLNYVTPIFRTSDVMELLKNNGTMTKDLPDRIPFRALENGENAQSQPRVFRMPSMAPDMAISSQPEVSEANCVDSSIEISPPSPEISLEAACPMCGEAVDAIFLRSYNGGKRMNIRTQTKFCRAHKKKSARIEWAERGYPTIDWNDFDTRLAQHHSYLKSLLDGEPSYHRNILAEQVRTGKDRTLLQAVSNSENLLTPGYYGSRGFRAMSENIMDRFSSQLRRIAVTDRLIAARGVTGYVQNVLVPELAVRLICEDMSLGVEEARQVMRESVGLGDLLNEEVEDVVTWKEGDETL